jgi:hypothetical protein
MLPSRLIRALDRAYCYEYGTHFGYSSSRMQSIQCVRVSLHRSNISDRQGHERHSGMS